MVLNGRYCHEAPVIPFSRPVLKSRVGNEHKEFKEKWRIKFLFDGDCERMVTFLMHTQSLFDESIA